LAEKPSRRPFWITTDSPKVTSSGNISPNMGAMPRRSAGSASRLPCATTRAQIAASSSGTVMLRSTAMPTAAASSSATPENASRKYSARSYSTRVRAAVVLAHASSTRISWFSART